MNTVTLHEGDNRLSLRRLIDQGVRVHSVVTDPPYGLVSIQKRFGKDGAKGARTEGNDGSFARLSGGFMGKAWDGTGIERDPEFWRLIYDILLPGGYVFAFSGSRTGHWQACAMEMAGFIMHPMHGWVFGCLDTATMAATPDGDKPYTDLKPGDDVICYDPTTGEYSVQPILEVVEYDYADTAYRLVGDHGEQVVSRNHRCIVERDGSEVFEFAETLEQQAIIPVLEDLRGLREALRLQRPKGHAESCVLEGVQGCVALARPRCARGDEGSNDNLSGLRQGDLEARGVASQDSGASILQPFMPGEIARANATGPALQQGSSGLDRCEQHVLQTEDGWTEKPLVEWRGNTSQPQRQPRSAADQVCSVPTEVHDHEPKGRLCDGASLGGCEGDGASTAALGSGASYEPQGDRQSDNQSDAVRQQRGAQAVRAWAGHKTDLVRVVPFHHVGKVWCLRVPTGAFVAVRDGVAFPTGNSGFPKAHAADKAIDKMMGVKGAKGAVRGQSGADRNCMAGDFSGGEYHDYLPATPEAAQWEGWAYGTQAQKPALEPIYLGQKPFDCKTGAANLLKHGVGAVNIDGCRVPTTENLNGGAYAKNPTPRVQLWGEDAGNGYRRGGAGDFTQPGGRHPANLILDGSPEVVAMFPASSVTGKRSDKSKAASVEGTNWLMDNHESREYSDAGSTARFFHQFTPDADPLFYHPKAGKLDRAGSKHPTVKPIALMQYLIRHITPPGGVVLDPFAGSGTTAEAARREGFNCILMEAEPEYIGFLKQRFGMSNDDFDDLLGDCSTKKTLDPELEELL